MVVATTFIIPKIYRYVNVEINMWIWCVRFCSVRIGFIDATVHIHFHACNWMDIQNAWPKNNNNNNRNRIKSNRMHSIQITFYSLWLIRSNANINSNKNSNNKFQKQTKRTNILTDALWYHQWAFLVLLTDITNQQHTQKKEALITFNRMTNKLCRTF